MSDRPVRIEYKVRVFTGLFYEKRWVAANVIGWHKENPVIPWENGTRILDSDEWRPLI